MVKTVRIESDDPAKRKFTVTVKGPVEKVVDIKPPSVYMQGKPGDVLEKVISITPSPKYPLSILEIRKVNKTPIQADLVKPDADGDPWEIHIKAASGQVQTFYDVLQVKTDSKLVPLFAIRVYTVFTEPRVKSPGQVKPPVQVNPPPLRLNNPKSSKS